MKGKFNNLGPLPEGVVTKSQSVMNIEAVIDSTPQELRTMRTYSAMLKDVPKSLSPEGQIVLHAIFACFDRQGKIEEGKFEDLVWGFEQADIPRGCTLIGIKELGKKGYFKFQSPDNAIVDIGSDLIGNAWIKYTPKLMDLVYIKADKK